MTSPTAVPRGGINLQTASALWFVCVHASSVTSGEWEGGSQESEGRSE